MRSASVYLALAASAAPALAHYNFESLIVNGQGTNPYEYVRRVKNSNSPVTDVKSPNIVCNVGGNDADSRAATKTYTVKPGDQIGFDINSDLGHPGPLAVYLSRAPDGVSANNYVGDGDWFKVYELTTSAINSQGLQWATFPNSVGSQNFTFTLPSNLRPGNYLVRPEHIALHGAGQVGGAQFYLGCAQIQVTGSGTGNPSPVVKFPGAYTGTEPGVVVNLYWPVPTSYTPPGPRTWPNGCTDHTVNLWGRASDGDCNP
ncbi:Endo-beta-1,4-glucanase D [Paramyrothecium foliicola]|nr:Endo-beta-1,4-glucanase D [Paramyrothecium foliicola]